MTENMKKLLKTALDEKVEAAKKLTERLMVGGVMLGSDDRLLYFYSGIDEAASILGATVTCDNKTINGKSYIRKSFLYNGVECYSLEVGNV